MSILVAVPCMDMNHVKFTESLLNMDKPEGTKVCLKPSSLIYDARNLLSLTAIENKFDYIMWMDSDMIFPVDTIPRLLEDLNHPHVHMVSGLYVKRTFPVKPVIYKHVQPPTPNEHGIPQIHIDEYVDYPRDQMFTVEGCGFGCVMMETRLIKQVWTRFGPPFAPFPWAGEDISFCYRVNQLLEKDDLYSGHIWCDSRIKCGHIGNVTFTEEMLKRGDT